MQDNFDRTLLDLVGLKTYTWNEKIVISRMKNTNWLLKVDIKLIRKCEKMQFYEIWDSTDNHIRYKSCKMKL